MSCPPTAANGKPTRYTGAINHSSERRGLAPPCYSSGGVLMRKLAFTTALVLTIGCGPTNRPGGDGAEAIMEGQPASYWVQQLKSTDPQTRATAVRLLKENGVKDNSVWNEIMGALKGNDPELQLGACEVFGHMGWDAEDAFEALKARLNDKDTRVGMAAGIAMAKINPEKAAQAGVPRSILKHEKKY